MTHRIDSMTTLPKAHVDKLKEHKIESFDQLQPYLEDTGKRAEFATKLGVEESNLRPFLGMAELFRIKSINPKYVEMFFHSGVNSIEKFKELNVDGVMKMVTEWKAKRNITLPTPAPTELQRWVAEAKEITTATVPS